MRMTVTALTLLAGIATMPAFAQDVPRVDKPVIATVPADEFKAPSLDLSALPTKAEANADAAATPKAETLPAKPDLAVVKPELAPARPEAAQARPTASIEDFPAQEPAVKPARRREATAEARDEPACKTFLPIVGGNPGGNYECE